MCTLIRGGGWCHKFKRCLHRTQVCDGSRSCKQVYEKTKNCKKVDCPAAISKILVSIIKNSIGCKTNQNFYCHKYMFS